MKGGSLKFKFGQKTKGRCERMQLSLDKGPACPCLAARGSWENRRRVRPFFKRGLEEWRRGAERRIKNLGLGRGGAGTGGGTPAYNKRLTACKSCLTLELAPELFRQASRKSRDVECHGTSQGRRGRDSCGRRLHENVNQSQ